MDFGAIEGNLPLILMIIALLVLPLLLRGRRKPEVRHQEIVQNLLLEVRVNETLAETSRLQQKPKKFMMTSWQMHKTKLDFLAQALQAVLSDAFTMAEDYNQQLVAAKKHRLGDYLANIDMDKLKERMLKSRQGLEEWLQVNAGSKEPLQKYPGLFDDLFGGGR